MRAITIDGVEAQYERLDIVTADSTLDAHGVKRVWQSACRADRAGSTAIFRRRASDTFPERRVWTLRTRSHP
jgi:hypothetical protein